MSREPVAIPDDVKRMAELLVAMGGHEDARALVASGILAERMRCIKVIQTLCLDCTGTSDNFIRGTDFARAEVVAAIREGRA